MQGWCQLKLSFYLVRAGSRLRARPRHYFTTQQPRGREPCGLATHRALSPPRRKHSTEGNQLPHKTYRSAWQSLFCTQTTRQLWTTRIDTQGVARDEPTHENNSRNEKSRPKAAFKLLYQQLAKAS